MSEEEKLEDIIRRKFAEKEFVFNEENWEKAEAKLDAAKRKKSAVKWTSIFLLGLFAGIVLMFPFVVNKNEKSGNEMAAHDTKVQPENELAELQKEENKNISSKENDNVVSQAKTTSENQNEEKEIINSSANKKTPAENTAPEIKTEKNLPKKINSDAPKLAETNNKSNNGTAESYNSENKLSESERKDSSTPLGMTKQQKKKVKESEPNNISEQTALNRTENTEKNTPEKITNKQTQSEIALAQSHPVEKTLQQQTKEKDSLSVKESSLAETSAQGNTGNNSNQQPAVQTQLKDSAKSDTHLQASAHADSASVIAAPNKPAEPTSSLGGLTSANIFSVDAGTDFVTGWHYGSTVEARGFNPVIGIGFTHYFNQKYSLYAGIQYGSVANLKASQKTFSSTTFDFGSNTVDTIINTKTLYYAVLPIEFQYHFNNKNSIGIGGSVSYLVNTTNKIIINTQSGDSINNSGTSKTETGYYAGAFNRWDLSLAVAYRRRISGKFSVCASANYGLLDIKSNSFFSQEKFERNIGFKIVFSYDLFQY